MKFKYTMMNNHLVIDRETFKQLHTKTQIELEDEYDSIVEGRKHIPIEERTYTLDLASLLKEGTEYTMTVE